MRNRIISTIEKTLKPEFLQVINNSHLHLGHIENDESGETHFLIEIKSEDLKKMTKLQAHRKINELVKDEFEKGLHALEIKML